MKRTARLFAVLLAAVLIMDCSGCSPEWKRKFVRKRAKKTEGQQPILTLQSDAEAAGPASVRYRERFAYWKAWHTELLNSLGDSRKRDVRYLDGAIGELGSMYGILPQGPEAEHLHRIISDLNQLKEKWNARTAGDWHVFSTERSRLEQLQREIDKSLNYSKVKSRLPDEPQANSESSNGEAKKP